ncbi:hypothetical protein C8R44DRAFT_322654 [Mycena epipterygia]|nr:hypothetical protein C8R44DRAFT_322654 [Mycena epipterygia]
MDTRGGRTDREGQRACSRRYSSLHGPAPDVLVRTLRRGLLYPLLTRHAHTSSTPALCLCLCLFRTFCVPARIYARPSQSASTSSGRGHPLQRAVPPIVWHSNEPTRFRAQAERTVCTSSSSPGLCSTPRTMHGTLTLVRRRSAALDPHGERISRTFRITALHVCFPPSTPISNRASFVSAPRHSARECSSYAYTPSLHLTSRAGKTLNARARRSSVRVISTLVPVPAFPLASRKERDALRAASGDASADGGALPADATNRVWGRRKPCSFAP